jgi:cobalt-zinc-cadmium efflux system membrane fusion protein
MSRFSLASLAFHFSSRSIAAGVTAVSILVALPGCHHKRPPPVEASKLAAPPAGQVWLTEDQVADAHIAITQIGLENVDDTILTSGRVSFADIKVAHVFSPVTGRVMAVSALLGQHVKKGDPLAVIQSPDIGQYSSDLSKALADLAAAERDYKREKGLWEKHATSQKDFETAEDTFRKAKAERDRAGQKAAMLHSGAVNTVTQSFTLTSPGPGEVLVRNLSAGVEVQGQYAGGQSQELFTIGELDEVWVIADVYELDMARVVIGSPAQVTVVAYPNKVFDGKVDWVSGMLDPATRTAKVRCTFANPDRFLKPEMYATVSISVEARNELAIPKGSAIRLGDQTLVYVERGKTADGRLKFQALPVSIDEGEGGHWLPVSKGLVAGDHVVTAGTVLLSGMM